MKYVWIEEETCVGLTEKLGAEVVSVSRGLIILPDGRPATGLEIETKAPLPAASLASFTREMEGRGLKRIDVEEGRE